MLLWFKNNVFTCLTMVHVIKEKCNDTKTAIFLTKAYK